MYVASHFALVLADVLAGKIAHRQQLVRLSAAFNSRSKYSEHQPVAAGSQAFPKPLSCYSPANRRPPRLHQLHLGRPLATWLQCAWGIGSFGVRCSVREGKVIMYKASPSTAQAGTKRTTPKLLIVAWRGTPACSNPYSITSAVQGEDKGDWT